MRYVHRTALLPCLAVLAVTPALAQRASSAPAATGPAKVDAMDAAITDGLRVMSDRHWHKGEYCHLINLSRIIVAADPRDVETYADAGYLLWSMDRNDEAVALYEQGVADNPQTSYMYDELGWFYANRKKDYPRAVTYYEKAAAAHDGNQMDILHGLAHAYEKTGQYDKALKVWKRAAATIPGDGAAKMHLERVRRILEQQGRSGG